MVVTKNKTLLVLSLILSISLLGVISACHCGDGAINQFSEECDNGALNGFLCSAGYGSSCTYCTTSCKLKTVYGGFCGDGIKQECLEECDDGNIANGDGCSSVCEVEEPQPTCDHEIAVRYSYSNSFGTGIAIGYENGTWAEESPVSLDEGNYKIKYLIDNKKEAQDNIHVEVKIDGNNLIPEYNHETGSFHSKEIIINTGEFCGLHTISLDVTSDGEECDLSDNHAERQIYINCEVEPPVLPVCGNNAIETGEECDDGNTDNGDGCSSACQLEQIPPEPVCGDGSVNQASEECDDGNTANDDGCSSICKIEEEENEEEDDDEEHSTRITSFVQSCEPDWQCSQWGDCVNEFRTRKCTDMNSCSFSYNKPAEMIGCELQKVLMEEEEAGKGNLLLWMLVGISLMLLLILIALVRRKK